MKRENEYIDKMFNLMVQYYQITEHIDNIEPELKKNGIVSTNYFIDVENDDEVSKIFIPANFEEIYDKGVRMFLDIDKCMNGKRGN